MLMFKEEKGNKGKQFQHTVFFNEKNISVGFIIYIYLSHKQDALNKREMTTKLFNDRNVYCRQP